MAWDLSIRTSFPEFKVVSTSWMSLKVSFLLFQCFVCSILLIFSNLFFLNGWFAGLLSQSQDLDLATAKAVIMLLQAAKAKIHHISISSKSLENSLKTCKTYKWPKHSKNSQLYSFFQKSDISQSKQHGHQHMERYWSFGQFPSAT